MLTNLKLTGLRRINYYGCASFWICDCSVINKTILQNNNVNYCVNRFTSAAGTICERIEIL